MKAFGVTDTQTRYPEVVDGGMDRRRASQMEGTTRPVFAHGALC